MGLIAQLTGRRVYLDSNVFIYAFENYPEYHHVCADIIAALEEHRLQGITSELALVEILYRPAKSASDLADALDRVVGLSLMPVSRQVILRAAALRAVAGLKAPDAIHIATAVETGCELFLTNNRRIKSSSMVPVMYLQPKLSL